MSVTIHHLWRRLKLDTFRQLGEIFTQAVSILSVDAAKNSIATLTPWPALQSTSTPRTHIKYMYKCYDLYGEGMTDTAQDCIRGIEHRAKNCKVPLSWTPHSCLWNRTQLFKTDTCSITVRWYDAFIEDNLRGLIWFTCLGTVGLYWDSVRFPGSSLLKWHKIKAEYWPPQFFNLFAGKCLF